MKNIIIISSFIFLIQGVFSQKKELPIAYLNKDVTTYFLSKVHIDKTDLSTSYVAGQLENKKILAIKPINDDEMELGIVTIIGQDFFIQYRLKYTYNIDLADKSVNLLETETNYFLHPDYDMTNIDMNNYSKKIERLKPNYFNTSSKDNKLVIQLNNIVVKEKYIFIDYSIVNQTNLLYEVSDVKYMIDDKKVNKNTNAQRDLMLPVYQHNENKTFKKNYRNIICFKKMTFPDNKVFVVEVAEKQTSGRTAKLTITYLDILNADSL